jgi:thymidylate kinase
MELSDTLHAPDSAIALDTPGPYLYFSPFTARIRLPADLPPELAAKIDDYTARKTALKQALRDELYKQDRAFFNSTRTNALKALAAKQEPEFAALEQLAEEIRVGLAPLPNPARPPALPLPASLTNRIGTYLERKAAWQRAMVNRMDEVRAALPDDRVEFSRIGGSVTIQVVANRKAKDDTKAKREKLIADLVPFNAEHRTAYLELAREKDQIQHEVLQVASSSAGVKAAKSIDKLLYEFSYALGQHETWLRYADYETAVLQPGLSPEQRRLLFGAALEKLDLPLLNR